MLCIECPLDEYGDGCFSFRGSDGDNCPTLATYQEACALAEAAEKEASK
jgi:hypothetical protein